MKRIAFIRPKAWPLANVKVGEALREQFPDAALEIIDVERELTRRPDILLVNLFATFFIYGADIIQRRKKLKESFWRTPFIFSQVRKLLRRKITPGKYQFTFQIQSLFDCSVPGVPHFIYTDHTHLANLNYPDFKQHKLYTQKWIALETEIYNNASLIFVRSSNIEKSVVEQYRQPLSKVKCVYAGSNVDTAPIQIEQKNYSEQRILFVGLDWERKGGPDLVEAFRQVRQKYPAATLTIVGAAPQINVPNCTIAGKVSQAELRKYYNSATIFCMPTHVEPFGIVFLEAMQFGLPLIGTCIGAVPDLIRDGWNGWLVNPGDVNAISEALVRLLESPDLCRTFGERNLSLVNSHYSWDKVGNRIREHIQQYNPEL